MSSRSVCSDRASSAASMRWCNAWRSRRPMVSYTASRVMPCLKRSPAPAVSAYRKSASASARIVAGSGALPQAETSNPFGTAFPMTAAARTTLTSVGGRRASREATSVATHPCVLRASSADDGSSGRDGMAQFFNEQEAPRRRSCECERPGKGRLAAPSAAQRDRFPVPRTAPASCAARRKSIPCRHHAAGWRG